MALLFYFAGFTCEQEHHYIFQYTRQYRTYMGEVCPLPTARNY